MRQKIELAAAVLFLAGLILLSRNVSKYVTSDRTEAENLRIVLDSGHGGADPGKVGINGEKEKDINLAITKRVEKLLKEKRIEVIMTREEDVMLTDGKNESTKVEDMKMRAALINQEKPALAVSVHQNSYHQEGVKGAQVFYYTHSEEAKRAAGIMQNSLLALNPENSRKEKANNTYYLLKRTEVPTIIVECGFLSNREEAELLATEEYQQKVAEAVAEGILTYLEK